MRQKDYQVLRNQQNKKLSSAIILNDNAANGPGELRVYIEKDTLSLIPTDWKLIVKL
jgi:hypothetical protein